MNELCKCDLVGFCTRHKINKGQRSFDKCKGVEDSKDCGLSYWQAWEQGRLGATAPPEPVLYPSGFCDKKVFVQYGDKSSVGTNLHLIIFRETGVEIPCDECKEKIYALNQITIEEVEKERANIVADIAIRAKKQSPKLWQKIAVSIDEALNTGFARKTIDQWLTEAISMEPKPQPIIPKKKK